VPSVSVAVLEAGEDRTDDPTVLAPGLLTALYGNPDYDWIYTTTPQSSVNDRVIGHPRGKQLGGSSAINYLAFTHASQQNINDWGSLGNDGWSWDDIFPYYLKSENFTAAPASVTADLNISYIDPQLHGVEGQIHNGFPHPGFATPFDEAWPRTYDALGLGISSDPKDGLALGGYNILTNVNPDTNSRSYSATTYLKSAADRPNLKVYTGALVNKVHFDTNGPIPEASGVSFTKDGSLYTIEAHSEVILSAGSYGSPQILELSGIGSEEVLAAAGVDVVLSNPHVGENLQDHCYMPLGFKVNPGISTLDDLVNETFFNEAYDQYLADASGPLAQVALGGALLSASQIIPDATEYSAFKSEIDAMDFTSTAVGREEQFSIVKRNLFDPKEAIAQHMNTASGMNPEFANDTTKLFAPSIPGNYFTILGVLEHPFSRGTVHIKSSNAADYPLIDPHYLEHPADIKILSQIVLHIQNSLAVTAPLSDLLVDNGTALQHEYTRLTPENVEGEIKRLLQTEYHPVGTCSMLPKDKGGVVDSKLKVHGVEKLRIVDASVFPLLPRANMQSLVYAVAERAADWIKADMSKGPQGPKGPKGPKGRSDEAPGHGGPAPPGRRCPQAAPGPAPPAPAGPADEC
jgi:choline dehydrogenase